MKRYIFLLFILLCTLGMKAQYVRVVAPKHVSVGEEFQVEYTVYTQDVRRFQLGRLSNGLEKVYGPATSSQSNYQFINGHASSSSTVTFAYVFVATKKGNLGIGPAKIVVNGQEIASTPVRINASGNAKELMLLQREVTMTFKMIHVLPPHILALKIYSLRFLQIKQQFTNKNQSF